MAKNPMQAVRPKKKKRIVKKTVKKKKSKTWLWIFSFIVLACVIGISYFMIQEKKVMTLSAFRKSVPEGFEAIGIDVSHHQGTIEWEKLMIENGYDSLIHFVYCKATEGITHFDTKWNYNRQKLNELGIPNGAYHFFSVKEDPIEQARHFMRVWKKRDIDLPPVLDVETEPENEKKFLENIQKWLTFVEDSSGFRPVIYTSLHFYETKFNNTFPNYKFWIAAYSKRPKCIEDPRIIHWQFTEKGRLPGIKENVDINVSKLKY
jgi:lysozyme